MDWNLLKEITANNTSESKNYLNAIHLNKLKEIKGSLNLYHAQITELSLPELAHVGTNLILDGTALLKSVSMDKLKSVNGTLNISRSNVSKLALTINHSDFLIIQNNKALTSLNLNELKVCKVMSITNNEVLSQIELSDNINDIQTITINDNANLSCDTICGLTAFKSFDTFHLNVSNNSEKNIGLESCEYTKNKHANYSTFGALCASIGL